MTTSTKTPFLQYDRTLGVASMEGRGFYYPVDVAIAGDGKIYGLSRSHEGDPRGVRVCILDLDSGFHGVFGSVGESDGQFTWATAVAQDVDGRVYVSDEYTQRISIFDSSGNFRAKWGTHGSVVGEIDGPSGLAFTCRERPAGGGQPQPPSPEVHHRWARLDELRIARLGRGPI